MSNSSKTFDVLNYGSAGVGVSAMVSSLTLNQEINLKFLALYLLIGLATFVIALISTVNTKKKDLKTDKGLGKAVGNVVGIAATGYVLVYWASYQSFWASITVEAILLICVVSAFLVKHDDIGKKFGKLSVVFLLVLFFAGLFPF
jgi:hypothetical protein